MGTTEFREAAAELKREWRKLVELAIAPPIVALEKEIRDDGLPVFIVRFAGAGLLAFVVYEIASS